MQNIVQNLYFCPMTKLRFYLDLRGKAKDGKGSILLVLTHNYSSASFPTGIRVSPNEWDSKQGTVVENINALPLNASLQKKKSDIENRIAILSLSRYLDDMTASEIKRDIQEGTLEKRKRHLVTKLFSDYIATGNLKPKTVEIYNTTLKKIVAFAGEDVKIEEVNYVWLRSFEQYLAKEQGINGRSIYLRAFRAVCNYAKKLDIPFRYPFQDFHVKQEETRKRSVPVEVLRSFMSVPVNEKQSVSRDYFFLMFYLIGINIKDLLLARKSQVIDGRLEYTREKTRKKYSIKIEPEAQALLDKYRGKGDYLLEAMNRFGGHKDYIKDFTKTINNSLKTIGDGMISDITTYFARHCWATYADEIGIPLDTISRAMGHSFGNRVTLVYIKPDQSKIDEANRKVIDYLLNR